MDPARRDWNPQDQREGFIPLISSRKKQEKAWLPNKTSRTLHCSRDSRDRAAAVPPSPSVSKPHSISPLWPSVFVSALQ